jgi:hypothetical protein
MTWIFMGRTRLRIEQGEDLSPEFSFVMPPSTVDMPATTDPVTTPTVTLSAADAAAPAFSSPLRVSTTAPRPFPSVMTAPTFVTRSFTSE